VSCQLCSVRHRLRSGEAEESLQGDRCVREDGEVSEKSLHS